MRASSIAATALSSGEAGLHSGSQDSIGGQAGDPPHPARPSTSRRPGALRQGADDGDDAGRRNRRGRTHHRTGRSARPARRPAVAGHAAPAQPGPGRASRYRAADQGLQRLRPHGSVAPHRPPRPHIRPDPPPESRRHAGCGRRRRNGDDRGSVRAFRGAAASEPTDCRGERGRHSGTADEVPRLRRDQRRRDRGQLRMVELLLAAPLPARHRQALDGAVHAGQGLGPDPARGGSELHRVQLHAAAGRRLPPSLPCRRRGAADGRRRSIRQHDRRSRVDSQGVRGGRRAGSGLRPELPAAHQRERRQVRQDRRGHECLARRGEDKPLRVLPVLARCRRSRRGQVPAHLHLVRPTQDRGAGSQAGGPSGGASGAESRRVRPDGSRPRRRCGPQCGTPERGGLLQGADSGPGRARRPLRRDRPFRVHVR